MQETEGHYRLSCNSQPDPSGPRPAVFCSNRRAAGMLPECRRHGGLIILLMENAHNLAEERSDDCQNCVVRGLFRSFNKLHVCFQQAIDNR